MRLPEIELDDRRFQDLVSEARLQINRACPEWTEHNVSDPGITLIELFAWMTEMTIYRLNRVPDKLHVALLELLGIQLDGAERGAHAACASGSPSAPEEPVEIPGGRDRGRHAAHGDRGVGRLPGRRGLHDPGRCAPRRTCVQRGGQFKDVGVADGDGAPAGRRPAAVRQPAGGRRRALPRLRRADRAAADRRSTWRPRRRAARASTRRTRRCAGRSPRATTAGRRPRCSRTSPAASTTARAPSSCSCPPRSAVAGARRPPACTGCAAGSTTGPATAARRRRYTHPPEIYSITAAPIGALLPATHASRVEDEVLGVSDGTPGQVFPLRYSPVLKPAPGETLEVQDPESGDWSTLGAARGLRRLDRVRPPLLARPSSRRDRARARRSARPTAAGRSTARSRRRARCCASPRYRYGGGRARQRRRRRADRAAQPDPRRRHGRQPARRRSAASTPRRSSTRASARRWRSARATARSRPRTSSSWPARRRRASRARSASRRPTAAPCRCTSSRTSIPADRQLAYDELVPDEELLQEVAEYLDERRLIGTTRAAAAVRVPRPVGRGEPAGLAARRHRARRGGRRARALHVPQPARRRQRRRPGRRLAVRPRAQPGRAVRRSSTPSTASSS